jgi:hypothetical protein
MMDEFSARNTHALSNALRSGRAGEETPPPPMQYPLNENLWFHHKVLKLDGWCFVGCRFDHCKLVIETPYFVLKNCYIDESNFIQLQGALINAVKFMNIMPGQTAHSFHPVRNPDGTISVGG